MLESAIKISNQTGPLCEQAAYTARDEYPWHECLCRYIVAKLLFSPLIFLSVFQPEDDICFCVAPKHKKFRLTLARQPHRASEPK